MLDTELELVSFTAEHRCDSCGAQAHALAQKPGRAEAYYDDFLPGILLCVHHTTKHYDFLLDSGWSVIEDQYSLDARQQ